MALPVGGGEFDFFVYDFDGTLFDTRRDIALAVNLTLRGLSLRELPDETVCSYVGNGVGPLMSRSLAGTGFDDLPRAIALFRENYDAHLMDTTRLFPLCRETLLHFARKKHAILSNKPEYFIHRILAAADCAAYFLAVVGGDGPHGQKPDPAGLRHLLRVAGVAAERALLIGDSGIDVETGKRAGVKTCGVSHGLGGRGAIRDADFIVDGFGEIMARFH